MNFTPLRGLAAAGLLACAPFVDAQTVGSSGPSAPLLPTALRGNSSFALLGGVAESTSPLRWGPVEIFPHLLDRFVYSDGVLSSAGHPANSYINSLTAGVLLNVGSHWTVDYTPTWVVYTNKAFQNTLEHAVSVSGGTEVGDSMLQFSQNYSSTNSFKIETGHQTGQETSTTGLNLSHRFNDHLSVELGIKQNLQFIDASPDNYDWSTEDWLVYRVASRLDFSVGYRLGYIDFDPGAYMTYAQPQARIRWKVSDKLTLNAQIGRETRQIHKTGIPKQSTPTYNASLEYQPFEHTKLSISANQTVAPSFFSNSVTEIKGWSAELEQRLLGHFTLNTGLSAQKSHYSGSHTEFAPNYTYEDIFDEEGTYLGTQTFVTYTPYTVIDLRNDSTRTFHVKVSVPVMGRGTFTVLYEEARNTSDSAGLSFRSHQIGCEVGYRF